MSGRKIEAWHKAGVIDDATRDRLLAYEEQNTRPLALWAVFGVGALAIGLGLISVIAANWDDIPGQIRLAVHFLLIGLALGGLLLRERQLAEASPWAVEALLFVAGLLCLTFFGHLGQVYQTSSPLWRPLGVWLLLFAPLILVTGRSWLAAALLGVTLVYCAWDYAIWLEYPVFFDTDEDASGVWIAVVTALPLLAVAPLAAYLRTRSARVDFWRRLEQLALAYAVGGASLGTIVASAGGFDDGSSAQIEAVTQMVRTLMALAAGAAVAVLQPGVSGRMAGAIIAGSGLTLALSVGASGYEVFAAMLFMALWAGIAAASLLAGWRGVFQLAVGAIALRLIVLSFELASDLLLSGFGLIVSGVLILAIAWVAYKVSQAYAPSDEQGVQ